MKAKIVFVLLLTTGVVSNAATVSDVTARQRWPWNGLVDIDYTIIGDDTENTAIAVKVTDTDTGRIYTPTNFLETPPTDAGRHRITWSTEADRLDLIASNAVFEVSLLKYATQPVRSDLYCVIDLTDGPDAERWPVSYLSAVPEGGWTDEYKTTKIVLRRIEKGGLNGIEQHLYDTFESIAIDAPYYIGVFEITSAQYKLMTGTTGASIWYKNYGDKRPQRGISYDALRGTGIGVEYPETEVKADSIIGILKTKTSLACELPTEEQWEYACRAGTVSLFNNGGSSEPDMLLLGRCKENKNDGTGGFSGGVTTVGSYLPNRWGLYDMHGNANEWVLDWCRYSIGARRRLRGGCGDITFEDCSSLSWVSLAPSDESSSAGFRLCVNFE